MQEFSLIVTQTISRHYFSWKSKVYFKTSSVFIFKLKKKIFNSNKKPLKYGTESVMSNDAKFLHIFTYMIAVSSSTVASIFGGI